MIVITYQQIFTSIVETLIYQKFKSETSFLTSWYVQVKWIFT